MKKFFLPILLTFAACLVVSAQEVQSGIPSYDNLQSLAMDALNRQDYKTAYNTYCLMDSVYCKQLKTMCDEDQRLRHLLPKDGTWPDSLRREIQTTDSLNIVRLQELIAQYGFPTYDNVGHQGVNDASLMAQHSEPEFLHWFLEQAKSAADNGNFDLTWIAYMTDRDLDHQDKPQLYGTQGLTRDGLTGMALIDDIEHLNERRKSVGMGPIEDYLPHMDMPDFYFHPSLVDYRQYSLNLRIESQDESIAIYHAAPYRLVSEDASTVNTTLQQLYSKYKHTMVSRDIFLQECKALQDWLKSK